MPATNGSTAKGPVVCVYCGSGTGKSPAHMEAARALAHEFHRHGVSLVYGGGSIGLMGEVARTLVSLSGPDAVHGIMPAALVRHEFPEAADEDLHKQLDGSKYGRTTVVQDMHERKNLMAREVFSGGPGSGFVALSGGYGTMEELMEVTTWNQLGIHSKPVVLFNVDGYWDGLVQWIGAATKEGFVGKENSSIVAEGKTAEDVVHQLINYELSDGRYKLQWEPSR